MVVRIYTSNYTPRVEAAFNMPKTPLSSVACHRLARKIWSSVLCPDARFCTAVEFWLMFICHPSIDNRWMAYESIDIYLLYIVNYSCMAYIYILPNVPNACNAWLDRDVIILVFAKGASPSFKAILDHRNKQLQLTHKILKPLRTTKPFH